MFPSIKKCLALLLALVLVPMALAETPASTAAPVVESTIQDDGRIRVLLRSLKTPEALHIAVNGVYAVENNPGFRFERDAEIALFAHEDGVWLTAGGLTIHMGEALTLTRHAAADGEPNGLTIAETGRSNLYGGDLTVSWEKGGLRAVLTTDVEEYLCGVVACEMSDSFPIEALKAQAVAARTYAMQRRAASGARDYDVTDTTSDQVFRGCDPRHRNVAAAVEATRGVVGMCDGAFAACYYTASNGGQVAEPGQIWGGGDGAIRMKDDPYDLENPRSLVNAIEFSRDLSDCASLRGLLAGALEPGWEPVEVTAVTPEDPESEGSRMFRSVRFDLTVRRPAPDAASGWEERRASVSLSTYGQLKDRLGLGLNGGDYELITAVETRDGFALEMRRFGHGVGMSQRGAQWMAGQCGFTWREILEFYYPGMSLERIDWQPEPPVALADLPAMGRARTDPTPLPELQAGERYGRVALRNEGSALNVREAPSTGAEILDRLENGRRLILCGEPDADGWLRIRTAGLTGYVKSGYVRAEN